MNKFVLNFLILIQFSLSAFAQTGLPKSINIASGIPLTFAEIHLDSMGLKPHQETGGWGDVMANVAMALDIKSQFPEVKVRLIVTLNDIDSRPHVNRVRKLIPNVLVNDDGSSYLNPDLRTVQFYKGIEIYFVNLPDGITLAAEGYISEDKKKIVEAETSHIPKAELGVQFSANNSPFSNSVIKAENLYVYFHEFESFRQSYDIAILNYKIPILKLNSGPNSFGAYGFGNENEKVGSDNNRKVVSGFLSSKGIDINKVELTMAYARDDELIEDYLKALELIANDKNQQKDIIVVYKGSGEVKRTGRLVQIPLAQHSFELNKALISESTISPLITGDVSFSLALRSTTPSKTFLYEGYEWKRATVYELFRSFFFNNTEMFKSASKLFLSRTNDLEKEKISRSEREKLIYNLVLNSNLHFELHKKISKNQNRLNLADNLMNVFQLSKILNSIKNGISKDRMYLSKYINWMIEITKEVTVSNILNTETFLPILNKKIEGSSEHLLYKWFAMYTLWEMGKKVDSQIIHQIILETSQFINRRDTEKKMMLEMDLMQFLEQLSGSEKSRYQLYLALQNKKEAQQAFSQIRKKFNEQSSKRLLLKRSMMCRKSISPVAK